MVVRFAKEGYLGARTVRDRLFRAPASARADREAAVGTIATWLEPARRAAEPSPRP